MKRFEVWLVNLDPTIGSEIKKTRPAVIVSPDELNSHLRTVIIVPVTTGRTYAFRVPTQIQGKKGVAAIDPGGLKDVPWGKPADDAAGFLVK